MLARNAGHILREALDGIARDRRRLLPMALGIVWGMASVMVLLAVAGGFERSQRTALGAYGDRFVLLRLNRAELDRAGGGRERRLMMDEHDVERLRDGAPAIRHLSPMNMAYRVRVTARNGAGANVFVAGALPEITRLRNLPLAEGRFHDEIDEAHRRRVMVLGPTARRQLFGDGPAVGETVRVAGFETAAIPERRTPAPVEIASRRGATTALTAGASVAGSAIPDTRTSRIAGTTAISRDVRIAGELFEVIGVLEDVEVQRESYVSVARLAFVPFATSSAVFDDDFNTIFVEPRTIDDRDLALRQFREVMGARYGFEPDDENAVLVYFDSIERARSIRTIFGTLRFFLSLVGVLLLAIGALGVMNVVLVSIAARRFEIGLRKALGATPRVIYWQFFAETAIGCVLSGGVGFLLGAGGIALLGAVPLPEGFSRPVLDLRTTALALALLSATAVTVGIYPARRAARLPPVEALRGST